jgi:hypothetical protein
MTEKDAYIKTMELLKSYEAMYPPIHSKEDKEKVIEEIRDVMYPFTDYYKDGAKKEFYAALAVAIRSKLVKFESRIHIDFLRTYIQESYLIYKHNKNITREEDSEDSSESIVHQMLKGLMRGN